MELLALNNRKEKQLMKRERIKQAVARKKRANSDFTLALR